jgi:hypothetical protein
MQLWQKDTTVFKLNGSYIESETAFMIKVASRLTVVFQKGPVKQLIDDLLQRVEEFSR